jgi:hypothetical protein
LPPRLSKAQLNVELFLFMSFFTYILQSETSNKFYIGQTNNH